jgi:hypothetical protein
VKIRGTASHVAEKYMSLARDALASGDMITAESYLQHAEHYNRIIMAAQSQLGPQGTQPGDQPNGVGGRPRHESDLGDEDGGEPETAEAGSGSQDRERHAGNREHHGGRGHGRHRGNGSEGVQDANGAEPAEASATDESESAPDPVG